MKVILSVELLHHHLSQTKKERVALVGSLESDPCKFVSKFADVLVFTAVDIPSSLCKVVQKRQVGTVRKTAFETGSGN